MLTSTSINDTQHHIIDRVDMLLLKPVRKLSLYNAIVSILSADEEQPSFYRSEDRNVSSQRSPTNNILIAEDNSANQRVIESMLTSIGYTNYKIVEEGASVIQALDESHFDIILMDIQMPVMDGIETTLQIRNSNKDYRNIIICAMTANAMQGDKERYLEAGMNDYLSKPIDLGKLRSMLSKWITKTNVVKYPGQVSSNGH